MRLRFPKLGERNDGTRHRVGRGYYAPGEIETLLVLDVDGTIIIINTRRVAGAIGGGSR